MFHVLDRDGVEALYTDVTESRLKWKSIEKEKEMSPKPETKIPTSEDRISIPSPIPEEENRPERSTRGSKPQ